MSLFTNREKKVWAKRWHASKVAFDKAKAELDTIAGVLMDYVNVSGDTDFTWKDFSITFVKPSTPKPKLNERTALAEIIHIVKTEGALTQCDLDAVIERHTTMGEPRKGYFRK